MGHFKRILVATDFSEHSSRALDTAIALAEEFEARIEVVHAFDVPLPFLTPYEVAIPETCIEEARAAAVRNLEELKARVEAAGLEVRTHLSEAPAHAAINRIAQEVEADLVVMGTRGNTGIKHVLMGSVAERTLRQAPCPVLTVH